MKIEYTLLTLLVSFILLGSCSRGLDKDEFVLQGILNGTNTKQVVLNYRDCNNIVISDTIEINHNKFITNGFINGATVAWIEGNKSSTSVEDPNLTWFFLEPKRINLFLTENKFKKAIIKGSITQTEFEDFVKLTNPITSEIEQLRIIRNELTKKSEKSSDSMMIKNQIEQIDLEWIDKLNKISKVKLKFAWNNPNSYLSAYFTDKYFNKISIDSTNKYYENLNNKVKIGLYGLRIKDKLNKRKPSKVGDIAPNFEGVNISGNILKLENFRGKYVLLDFWASWCKPCREGNPKLRRIYKAYHRKGFEIISISSDEDKKKWKNAILYDSISDWHHINISRNGVVISEYNVSLIPDYILIDKNGLIIGRNSSQEKFALSELEIKLEKLLK